MSEKIVKIEMDHDSNVCHITPLPGSRADPWRYLFKPYYSRVAVKVILLRARQKLAWIRRRVFGLDAGEWECRLNDIFDEKEILIVASIDRFNKMQERFKNNNKIEM